MRIRRVIATTLLVLLVVAAAGGAWLWRTVNASAVTPGKAAEVKDLQVAQGASLRSVLRQLEEQQLIGNARYLEWYLRCCTPGKSPVAAGIKAGHYRIAPGQQPLSILRQLVEGRVVLESITIVEGWTFAQMRAALARRVGLQTVLRDLSDAQIMRELGAPELPAEGQFAPDTYSFAPGSTSDLQIIRLAFEAQQRILQEAWNSRAPGLPFANPGEALTLASIVEKETGLASERARVAGVYINRLRIGMRLQSDPTVIYGIRNYDGNIRKSDLRRDGPYNTYTRAGLPPTPIALPGRDAIIATLHPEKTDALFFVAIGDGSGGHYFAATGAEHNRNVQRYLERLRAAPPDPGTLAEPPAGDAPAAPDAPATPSPAKP
ncbi:MAG TPA: endolytic transglycosylase MltG [Steroidobacteraceae bacterium]|nr:endolytic transglycosylase MltG [Steroidobacteraceae bacterium]